MTGGSQIYVDTNVFIHAREHHDEKANLLTSLFLSGRRFITSAITLAELVDKPHQLGQDSLIDWYVGNIVTSDWLDVLPVDQAIAYHAGVLKSGRKGLKLPDALHLSTAIAVQCTHFLTADMGITGPVVLPHNRYGLTRRSPPLIIIRPDLPTLEALLKSLSS